MVTIVVSLFTPKPTPVMQELIEEIRYPGKSKLVEAHLTGAIDEEELHGGQTSPRLARAQAPVPVSRGGRLRTSRASRPPQSLPPSPARSWRTRRMAPGLRLQRQDREAEGRRSCGEALQGSSGKMVT